MEQTREACGGTASEQIFSQPVWQYEYTQQRAMQIRNKAIDNRTCRYQQTWDKGIHERWPTAVVDCQANVMHSDANDAVLFSQGKHVVNGKTAIDQRQHAKQR